MSMARQYPASFQLSGCPGSGRLSRVSRGRLSSFRFRPKVHEFGHPNPFVEALWAVQRAINGGRGNIAGIHVLSGHVRYAAPSHTEIRRA